MADNDAVSDEARTLRPLVVPQGPEPPAQARQSTACEANCAHHRPVRLSWAKLLKQDGRKWPTNSPDEPKIQAIAAGR